MRPVVVNGLLIDQDKSKLTIRPSIRYGCSTLTKTIGGLAFAGACLCTLLVVTARLPYDLLTRPASQIVTAILIALFAFIGLRLVADRIRFVRCGLLFDRGNDDVWDKCRRVMAVSDVEQVVLHHVATTDDYHFYSVALTYTNNSSYILFSEGGLRLSHDSCVVIANSIAEFLGVAVDVDVP